MKYIVFVCVILSNKIVLAQGKLKIIKEDNRFLFYQIATKNDTILKNKNDVFYLHLPDSSKQDISIFITNGYLKSLPTNNHYQLVFINGMKYSHTKHDSIFNTLLEGNCPPQKKMQVKITNTETQKVILTNLFYFGI